MKIDVTTDIVICQPLERVARYASDPDHVPDWYANIKSVEWQTERPVRTGSRIAFVANFLGRRLAYTYEITKLSASHLVMRTSEGPFPMETIYSWEPAVGGTRMTLRNREEAARAAENTHTNRVGMCQQVTRGYYMGASA